MDDPILALIITVAASLAVAVPCLVFAYLCHRRRNQLKPAAQHLPVSAPARAQQDSSSWSFYGSAADSSLAKLSLADLAAATGGFSPDNIIGDGSFGFVYRAVLPDGAAVAVKRLATHGAAGNREFRAEMEVLGSLSHPNLARLLGYCAAGCDRILVYELLERGSLDAWLHGGGDDDADSAAAYGGGLDAPPPALPWPARLHVARGVAAALAFLHHDRRPPVLHRDVKASNVLLVDRAGGRAKVTDFGLARVVRPGDTHVSTVVAGTVGYVAPEYGQTWRATTKGDVYSYGVLLMELATGRRAVECGGGEEEECLVEWARRMGKEGRRPRKEEAPSAVAWELLVLGMRCTADAPQERPDMPEVLAALLDVAERCRYGGGKRLEFT